MVLGLVFAGSPTKIAGGVTIAGVSVGGMDAGAARSLLERRSALLAERPIVFVAGDRRFPIRADELGVVPDWRQAVDAAQRQGDGFGPLRGFRRLDVKVFGADVTPPISVLNGALQYELGLIAQAVDTPARDAALVRHGMGIDVVPARPGHTLDRSAAARTIVQALAALDRPSTVVELPLRTKPPRIRATAIARAARQARVALSAPVRLQLGKTRWLISRYRLAALLDLPSDGRTALRIAGPAADAWLVGLGKRVEQPAHDARFVVHGKRVTITPDRPGAQIDAEGTAAEVLQAALARNRRLRVAQVVVAPLPAKLTAARARSLGIDGLVSTFTTLYGGVPNRIHNVQLVAHLVDGKLIAPHATFSFNGTTGERSAAKGFLEAPVIVNGEVTTGLGGGVCQVSTTVFNAAFEAGLDITQRTNHALYISHYPQGRDATVDYPDVDLKFVNDSDSWLLLRTVVGESSLTVSFYGTPLHRRVVSSTAPLVSHGNPPVKKTIDPSLKPGDKVVDDPGVPAMTTSVTRDVYAPDGKLLHHDVWFSSYRAVPKLVRIAPPKKKHKPTPATTSPLPTTPPPTTPTTTDPTATLPTQ